MTNAVKQYVCDICAKDGVATSFKAPTALGMHKRLKHGIIGQSKASQNYREAKAKAAKVAISPELEAKRAKWRADAAKYRDRKLGITSESKHELVAIKKGQFDGSEAQLFIVVGRIQAFCETEAEKLGLSKEYVTQRCAQIFFASQIRS